jgi:hypothetical protein
MNEDRIAKGVFSMALQNGNNRLGKVSHGRKNVRTN